MRNNDIDGGGEEWCQKIVAAAVSYTRDYGSSSRYVGIWWRMVIVGVDMWGNG